MFSALPEAVLLAFERYVGDGKPLLPEGREHLLGLIRGHDLVFETLEEDHGAGEPPAEWIGERSMIESVRSG